jgi:apolipoprotein D and lipocalin family protein
MNTYAYVLLLSSMVLGTSCASIPKGASAVSSFDAGKYLGTWYEIARFDFAFEKDLNNTTANYSRNSDGTIRVENSGYNYKKTKWEKAIGRARFRGSSTTAELEVSFFGPFYAGYNVIMLDGGYNYALVAGSNLKYLWILSREKTIPDEVKQSYLREAEKLGYDTDRLVWVEQSP